jgi:glycosyltransferase involved in cell wall biosynthesis
MPRPFFSVVVPTYNRASIVMRCVQSCFLQTFTDFEVVVVDDASTDGTVSALTGCGDSRLRVVVHESNQSINPSLYTGACHSRGEWIVVLGSDWELFPYTLKRLFDIIRTLPKDIRVIRGRLVWDDGHVTPAFGPAGPIDYEERIRWVEEEGGNDAVRCLHRSVLATTPFFRDRRGAMETLWELSLAKRETSIYVDEILAMEHTDAANSYTRSVERTELIPRLLRDAPDTLWMAQTTLLEHGDALRTYAPRQYRELFRLAAVQACLTSARRRGLQYGVKYFRSQKSDVMFLVTLLAGLVSPKALAYGILAYRRLRGDVTLAPSPQVMARGDASAGDGA